MFEFLDRHQWVYFILIGACYLFVSYLENV